MRPLVAALVAALAALSVAGCSDPEPQLPQLFTCPRGQVIEVPANATNPASLCPRLAPSVNLTAPASAVVFRPLTLSWSVDAGDYTGGHSMLTMVRASTTSQPASTLQGPQSYGIEVARGEHQDLPARLSSEHTFRTPGTYYVRAYAEIQATGFATQDHWTEEQVIVVADVAATGNNTVVTHPLGDLAGKLDPAQVNLALGDGIVFQNDDVKERVFTPQTCAQPFEAVAVAAGAASEPLVFKVPGTCTFTTDDLQPQTLTVNVGA